MTCSAIAREIFRDYDIRGIAGAGLTVPVMEELGRVIASEALDMGETRLLVGADARLSSPLFRAAMIEGIRSAGCDVVDLGIVPTPVLYYATATEPEGSGVMITGSHNPRDYNGVKIVLKRQCLVDNRIACLYTRLMSRRLHRGRGRLEHRDLVPGYLESIASDLRLDKPLSVVVDCGNGVAGTVAPALLESLGCRVTPLYCEPDGHFPNHHPDPTIAENVQDLVREVRYRQADLGIALDGDGDRVILADGRGSVIDADRLMMCFARDILPANPGARVVFDVKSSTHLERLIRAHGGSPVMCRSGHSYVKRRMLETGALLGGEYSAHIFFGHRWHGFDDGAYAAARFLELMDRRSCSAADLIDELPDSHSTPELFIDVEEDSKFVLMAELEREMRFPRARLNTLDGIRAEFDRGWGLIRASNTTPRLVLRFEADTRDALDEIRDCFMQEVARILPFIDPGW